MSALTSRVSFWSAAILAATFSTISCGGGNNKILPPPCGTNTTDACIIQQFIFATTDSGQILSFPVNRSTGALGTATVTPGPQQSLGIAETGAGLVASDSEADEPAACTSDREHAPPAPLEGAQSP